MKDLTKGNIYKVFILFAIPMVLSGFLSQAYNIVDTVIAGKFLGNVGLAAIGSTAALISVISSGFWGYGSGFSIYIARLFGAKDYSRIKSGIFSNYILIFGVSAVISVLMILFHGSVFDMLNIDPAIRRDAFIYFAIYCGGLFFVIFTHNCVYIMNALGISAYPFYMSALSAVLNIGGNIFTVVVLRIGVAGLAISTVFSAFAVCICYIFKLRRCFKEMGVENEPFKFDFLCIRESFAYALPVTFQQIMIYLGTLAVSPMINGIGSSATAAYTVVTKVYDINANIYQNSAKTLGNYTAQCIGAKKYHKIKKGVLVGLLQGVMFLLPVLILCSIFSAEVCRLFFPKGYVGESMTYAVTFVRFYLPFVLFNLINNLFHSFCRGVKAMNLLIISTCVGTVSRTAASIFFIKLYGMNGIYIGWAISWITEAVFAAAVYFSGKWIPPEMLEANNIQKCGDIK